MTTGRSYAPYWPGPGRMPWPMRLRCLVLRPWHVLRYDLRWWVEARLGR